MADRYIPKIGENFSSIYSIENLPDDNSKNLVFEDSSYRQGNTLASVPDQIGVDGVPGEYTVALEQFDLLTAPTEKIELDQNALSAEDRLAITGLLFEYDFAIDSGNLERTVSAAIYRTGR